MQRSHRLPSPRHHLPPSTRTRGGGLEALVAESRLGVLIQIAGHDEHRRGSDDGCSQSQVQFRGLLQQLDLVVAVVDANR